ncbi:LLM class flavin-dependent oxidoreductase [Streptomyces gamaensis]|uniref:LLM class flavin-dependent oxidoreductase n=1 Tax=Streptomyces gamaensis TaxID=1763542 RepID=A0ABW0YVD6_9ACTN
MRISIALPNTLPRAEAALCVRWAVRAEERGFASVAVTERLLFSGHDPLLVLAGAAEATSRIGLLTNVLIGPLRSTAVLEKQVATLDSLSGGRFSLGLAPGVREDDFVAAGREFAARREVFEQQLARFARTERAPGRVPLLVAGLSAAAVRRTVRWADGWTAPGLDPEQVVPVARRVREAWARAGRSGAPRIVALVRFALGEDVADESARFVRNYFSVLGDEAEEFVARTPRTEAQIRRALGVLSDGGVDEAVLHPTAAPLSQVDRLADIVL